MSRWNVFFMCVGISVIFSALMVAAGWSSLPERILRDFYTLSGVGWGLWGHWAFEREVSA